MKRFFPAAILALVVIGSSILSGAEKKSPAPADPTATPKPALAGNYAGKWTSTADTSGGLNLTLKQDGPGPWIAEAMFTFDGTEVPTQVKSVQVDGARVQLVFDWVVDGTAGQSKLTGELKGDKLLGAYESSGAAGASKGTWTVTRR